MSHRRGGERTGLNKVHFVEPNFVRNVQVHHKGPPPGSDAGLLRKEAAGVKPRWERKMLFEFLDAVPRHEVVGDGDVVAG